MSDLFDDGDPGPADPGGNAPALSVSELSGAVKRVIEGEFGHVRVRGEVGRVSRPRSGHLYFDLKDDAAVLAAICWKGQAGRLETQPEEGLEVIATGRLTTYPGQSRYQLIVESVEPAGLGALMAMLEKRRKALAAEGLFDAARKRPLPVLPRVIGVITSPSGAVIRDILHRLRDRFPAHVLIWPVAVQGANCAPEVAAGIRGFNALPEGGPIPRPDLLIVARGGGSVEDLWGFNDESVVRAAADSRIPLISAVGHETDTTLIDHASDMRAPTPTAAAELAVPVRAELAARLADLGARQMRASTQRMAQTRQRLRDLGRGLARPQALVQGPRQRLDLTGPRLEPALRSLATRRRGELAGLALRPSALAARVQVARRDLARLEEALPRGLARRAQGARGEFAMLDRRFIGAMAGARTRSSDARQRLETLGQRLDPALRRQLEQAREGLARLDRLRLTLGYHATLARGFAVVHGPEGLLKTAAAARGVTDWQVEFADGKVSATPTDTPPKPARKPRKKPEQGSLF